MKERLLISQKYQECVGLREVSYPLVLPTHFSFCGGGKNILNAPDMSVVLSEWSLGAIKGLRGGFVKGCLNTCQELF